MEAHVNCHVCGEKDIEPRQRQIYHFSESGLDNVYLHNVDTLHCPKCGKDFVSIPRSPELLQCIAEAIVLKPGLLIGPEIRFLRKNLHLKAGEFAKMIGHSRVTLSGWENSKKLLQRPTDRAIRLIYVAHVGVKGDVRDKLLQRLREEEKQASIEYAVQLPLDNLSCSIVPLQAAS